MSVEIARHRFTVEQYERMGEAGILTEDDRVELIEAWVLDLDGPALEVHRSPAPEGYRDVRRPRRGEAVTFAAVPDLSVAVDAVLG